MQSKIGFFMMGLSVAYLFQAFKKRASDEGRTQIAGRRDGNVIDLMAWRRDMAN